jgi:amidohydrolase
MVELSGKVARGLFGARRVLPLETATMGGEDFAEYLKDAPGCFIYIGTGPGEGRNLVPWHHPAFDIDENAMPTGSRLLTGLVEEVLS